MNHKKILSTVKNRELVMKRRNQMIQGAISLFKEKGFHRTTTREIAEESGFSIGTLYEYIRKKEDVLFLVCDSIYEQVRQRLEIVIAKEAPSIHMLKNVVRSYYELMDEMQEEVLVMYQEVKSLEKEAQVYVLKKEREMVDMLKTVIHRSLPERNISDMDTELIANNIFIQGQMWGFRRWILQKQFTIDEYTDRQLFYLMRVLAIDA